MLRTFQQASCNRGLQLLIKTTDVLVKQQINEQQIIYVDFPRSLTKDYRRGSKYELNHHEVGKQFLCLKKVKMQNTKWRNEVSHVSIRKGNCEVINIPCFHVSTQEACCLIQYHLKKTTITGKEILFRPPNNYSNTTLVSAL